MPTKACRPPAFRSPAESRTAPSSEYRHDDLPRDTLPKEKGHAARHGERIEEVDGRSHPGSYVLVGYHEAQGGHGPGRSQQAYRPEVVPPDAKVLPHGESKTSECQRSDAPTVKQHLERGEAAPYQHQREKRCETERRRRKYRVNYPFKIVGASHIAAKSIYPPQKIWQR